MTTLWVLSTSSWISTPRTSVVAVVHSQERVRVRVSLSLSPPRLGESESDSHSLLLEERVVTVVHSHSHSLLLAYSSFFLSLSSVCLSPSAAPSLSFLRNSVFIQPPPPPVASTFIPLVSLQCVNVPRPGGIHTFSKNDVNWTSERGELAHRYIRVMLCF